MLYKNHVNYAMQLLFKLDNVLGVSYVTPIAGLEPSTVHCPHLLVSGFPCLSGQQFVPGHYHCGGSIMGVIRGGEAVMPL